MCAMSAKKRHQAWARYLQTFKICTEGAFKAPPRQEYG